LLLNASCINAILTVQELNNRPIDITYSSILLYVNVFHQLYQSALNVASVRCLYSSINQTLTPTHGVEEELSWPDARNE
jgi:hypothetical protein